MYRSTFPFALLAALALAPVGVGAQEPFPGIPAGGPGGPGGSPPLGAGLLLANTGRLELTDQQVVKLATIARRAYQRREAARPRADSARGAEGASPEGMREQARADLTDAIAVLTPEQQALAWEIVAGRAQRGPRPEAMPSGPGCGPGG